MLGVPASSINALPLPLMLLLVAGLIITSVLMMSVPTMKRMFGVLGISATLITTLLTVTMNINERNIEETQRDIVQAIEDTGVSVLTPATEFNVVEGGRSDVEIILPDSRNILCELEADSGQGMMVKCLDQRTGDMIPLHALTSMMLD